MLYLFLALVGDVPYQGFCEARKVSLPELAAQDFDQRAAFWGWAGGSFILVARMKHVSQGVRPCCFSGLRMGRTQNVRQLTRFLPLAYGGVS